MGKEKSFRVGRKQSKNSAHVSTAQCRNQGPEKKEGRGFLLCHLRVGIRVPLHDRIHREGDPDAGGKRAERSVVTEEGRNRRNPGVIKRRSGRVKKKETGKKTKRIQGV